MTDTVGAVYVRVMSDSSTFTKQLRKDAKAAGDAAGDDAGKSFGKSFDDRVNKAIHMIDVDRLLGPDIKNWGKDFAKQVKTAEAAGGRFRIKKFSVDDIISPADLLKMSKRLQLPIQDLASYIEREMVGAYRDGFTAMEKDAKEFARKQKARDKERVDFWLKEMKRIRPLSDVWGDTSFRRVLGTLGDDIEKVVTPAMRNALKDGVRVDWLDTEDAEARIRKFANTYRISFTDAERAVRKHIRKTLEERDNSLSWFSKVRGKVKNLITDTEHLDASMKKVYRGFRRAGSGGFFDGLTTTIGVVILAMYKMGRAAVSAGVAIFKGMGKAVSRIGEIWQNADNAGQAFLQMGSAAGTAFIKFLGSMASSIVGLAAIAAALVVIEGLLGAIAQLLSAALAAVVAIGSALYYVVAQAAFLVPIIGAMGLGFAATAIGGWDAAKAVGALVKAMNETDPKKRAKAWAEYNRQLAALGPNSREAVKALRPLVGGFDKLKKNAGEALFEGMAGALKKAKPLIDALKDGLVKVAGAVGNVIDGFLALGQDTAFMRDFNVMMDLSVSLIESLGAAAKDVFAGLNSFFAAMAPVVKLFGEDLKGIGESFKNWAQSEGGQKAILEFFTTARDMGRLFWDLLKEAGGALHDLFTAPATVEAAKALLTWITEKIQEFRKWIGDASEDGRLAEWFNNAKVVGQILWDVMAGLANAFKSLLTPESIVTLKVIAAWFLSWIWLIVQLTRLVGGILLAFQTAFNFIKSGVMLVVNIWKVLLAEIGKVIDAFAKAKASGKSMSDSIKAAIGAIGDAWDRFVRKIKGISWPKPPAWMSKVWGGITGKSAAGGLFMGPTKRLIGEEGPEVVIPLHRSLSRVDPSVRNMAAMMRGGAGAGGGTVSTRQMTNYWQITTPSPDGRVVASQVVNRMAAMAG